MKKDIEIFHLTHSPLKEVTLYLDCQCEYADNAVNVDNICKDLPAHFDKCRIVEPKGEKGPVLMIEASSSSNVILMKPSQFSYSVMGHYDDWESFVKEALQGFGVYVNGYKLNKVFKVGVRSVDEILSDKSINDFEVPFSSGVKECDFSEGRPIEYLVKNTQYYPEYNLFGREVRASRIFRSDRDMYKIKSTYDVDVFFMNMRTGIEPDEFEERLKQIHLLKNQLFFSAIRKDVLEAFK